MRWVNTLEAINDVEQAGTKGQWRIGDAIIKDLKEEGHFASRNDETIPDIEGDVFEECAERLAEKGIEHNGKPYSGLHIRNLFRAAYVFPRADRNDKYSWSVHAEAGTPENLKNAVTALRKISKTISKDNVRALIGHWAEEADEQRQKAVAKAKATKTEAKEKKAKASEKKLASKDSKVRAQADAARVEAQREIEEAEATIKELGAPPPFNSDLDVDTSDVSSLERWALLLGIHAHTLVMKREAKKALAAVGKIATLLTENEKQSIADGCNGIITLLEQINEAVKRPVRASLRQIQGGRA